EDDPVLEQPAVDVVGPLLAAPALHHDRHQRHIRPSGRTAAHSGSGGGSAVDERSESVWSVITRHGPDFGGCAGRTALPRVMLSDPFGVKTRYSPQPEGLGQLSPGQRPEYCRQPVCRPKACDNDTLVAPRCPRGTLHYFFTGSFGFWSTSSTSPNVFA